MIPKSNTTMPDLPWQYSGGGQPAAAGGAQGFWPANTPQSAQRPSLPRGTTMDTNMPRITAGGKITGGPAANNSQSLIDMLAGGRNSQQSRSLGNGMAWQAAASMTGRGPGSYETYNPYEEDGTLARLREKNAKWLNSNGPTITPHYPTHSAAETAAVNQTQHAARQAQSPYARQIGKYEHSSNMKRRWVPDPNAAASSSAGGGGAVGQVATTIEGNAPLYDRNLTQRYVNSQASQALEGADPRYLMHKQGLITPGRSLDAGAMGEVAPAMANARAQVANVQGVVPFMDELANRNWMLGGQQAQANEANQLANILAGQQSLQDYQNNANQSRQLSALMQLLSSLGG